MLDPRKENLDPSSQPRLKICSKMVYEHGLLCLLSLPSLEAQDEDDCDDINGFKNQDGIMFSWIMIHIVKMQEKI